MARIISGHARGRKLLVPPEGTRPTSDRAKEGLFSSLQVRCGFEGRRVLDLFAGSGALGLEALSRGAESVVLVDAHRAATDIIARNAKTVGLPGVEIVEKKASTYVASAPRNYFDLVLADPPYELDESAVNDMLAALVPLLRPGAMVVVERPTSAPDPQWPKGLEPTTQKLKKRTYGIARMDMAVYDDAEGEEEEQ